LTAEAGAPEFVHGDSEDNPAPAPSASKISESAAVTKAPATTAAQDTPEADASAESGEFS
jgi:hypothetical protein